MSREIDVRSMTEVSETVIDVRSMTEASYGAGVFTPRKRPLLARRSMSRAQRMWPYGDRAHRLLYVFGDFFRPRQAQLIHIHTAAR